MSDFQKIAVPATRSSGAVLAVRRRVVIFLLVFCVLSGLLGLAFSVKAMRSDTGAAVEPLPAAALAVAEEAGRDFLGSRASTVPAAEGLVTDWSKTPEGDPATAAFTVTSFSYAGHTTYWLGDADDQLVYLTRFRVVLNGRPYNLDVPVADAVVGPVLAGAPALLPARTGTQDAAAANYDNYDAASGVAPNVEDAISDWVTVYAQAGVASKELKALTGDQSDNTYNGLDGWTGELGRVVSAVPVGGGETGLPTGQIVQVGVVLTPPAANGPSLSTTYDLYVVTHDDSGQPLALPQIAAWGTAGSVEELTPAMNAN